MENKKLQQNTLTSIFKFKSQVSKENSNYNMGYIYSMHMLY
jgi:hypothetical protein